MVGRTDAQTMGRDILNFTQRHIRTGVLYTNHGPLAGRCTTCAIPGPAYG